MSQSTLGALCLWQYFFFRVIIVIIVMVAVNFKDNLTFGLFLSPLSFHHHYHQYHHIFENMTVKLSSPQSGLCGEPVPAIEGQRGGAADVGLQVEGDQLDKN